MKSVTQRRFGAGPVKSRGSDAQHAPFIRSGEDLVEARAVCAESGAWAGHALGRH